MERRLFSSKTRPVCHIATEKWSKPKFVNRQTTARFKAISSLLKTKQKIYKNKVISCVRANRLKCNGNGHTHCHRNVNVLPFYLFLYDLITHFFKLHTHISFFIQLYCSNFIRVRENVLWLFTHMSLWAKKKRRIHKHSF